MKISKIFFSLIFISSILFAQERMILRTNGEQIKLSHQKDLREVITESKIQRSDGRVFDNRFTPLPNKINGVVDTISYRRYGGTWNTNFGFFGQDVMLMWFEAPADITIKGIGFTCSDDTGAENATISLRLVKLNWTKEQLQSYNEAKQIGYYPSTGDGFNQIDYFGENATGNWISNDENNPLPPWTNHENPDSNTFNYDLWSDAGYGWPITPIASPVTAPVYQWVETSGLSNEPTLSRGDIFAVVATHDGINMDADRIGFWSDNTIGFPGWKFYKNGRLDPTVDAGWWTRLYTWDFAVAVDVTSCLPPYIRIVQPLITTILTTPREVCAEVEMDFGCYGGSDSVDVELVYILDNTDTNRVTMTSSDNYEFCAEIPGQSPETNIQYWVEVTDNTGWGFRSRQYEYFIFSPKEKTLIVFNGYDTPTGYPQNYYFGPSYFDYRQEGDLWSYGALSKELVDYYEYIYENCTSGPNVYNRDVIQEWFSSDNRRVYFLWGEEWLGADNGYTDQDYTAGSFEYDVLGITHSYNDVSFDGTSGQEQTSKFMPQEGTALGGPMFDLAAEMNATDSIAIDSICYDPMYEINLNNWHDGFEVRDDNPTLEVFMKAETRGIMGQPQVREVNVGVSRNIGVNHMTVFMAYDPISINSSPYYYWFGSSDVSSQMQAIKNLPIEGDVDDGDLNIINFSLSQNYPNPFNPSTTIKYSIPANENRQSSIVSLKVFDILGREVKTLINKQQSAGNYEVTFDASNLNSGVYFYKLTSGSFSESKKMLLIK